MSIDGHRPRRRCPTGRSPRCGPRDRLRLPAVLPARRSVGARQRRRRACSTPAPRPSGATARRRRSSGRASRTGSPTGRTSSRAASASGSPSRGRSSAPTDPVRRRADRQPRHGRRPRRRRAAARAERRRDDGRRHHARARDRGGSAAADRAARRPGRGSTRRRLMELAPSRLSPRDVLRVGAVGLAARRLRAALSALGIAIGIAAMVAVLAISESSKADLLVVARPARDEPAHRRARADDLRRGRGAARHGGPDGRADRAGRDGHRDRIGRRGPSTARS